MSKPKIYPLYVQKAQKKNRTQEEIHQHINSNMDLETFFNHATINSKLSLIKGIAHGVKVEDIEEDIMRYIRCLDKLIDELAKGKELSKILRD